VARTGEEPNTSGRTLREMNSLRHRDPAILTLWQTYKDRQEYLHGQCFYRGECAPEDKALYHIRATRDYIQDAERLAGEPAE